MPNLGHVPDLVTFEFPYAVQDFARNIGFVDARGWPDVCHPTTGDDFVCE